MDAIEQAVKNRIARFESALVGIPSEVRATIERLKSKGKRIGLCSNADVMEMAGWPRSPIAHLFDSTVFSCEAGCMKPEPEIYQKSLSELGAQPSETLFIGDGGSNELQGAKSLGMTTVMITGIIRELWPDRIESRKPFADFVIEKIPELVV
jgi:putative hydrolase of the HAD superfamily